MEQNEKHLLTIKSSRISSLKCIFFPMEYHFYERRNSFYIITITKNWIGQKTYSRDDSPRSFNAKGVILRKLCFQQSGYIYEYGRFRAGDVRKAKNILEQYIPKTRREWSDSWF